MSKKCELPDIYKTGRFFIASSTHLVKRPDGGRTTHVYLKKDSKKPILVDYGYGDTVVFESEQDYLSTHKLQNQ